jgi:hypothetical protein
VEVQIEVEEIEVEVEITTDQIEVEVEIQKCFLQYVMIVEKIVKFLSDLVLTNQSIAVNVLKKEVVTKEVEEVIEVEEIVCRTDN